MMYDLYKIEEKYFKGLYLILRHQYCDEW